MNDKVQPHRPRSRGLVGTWLFAIVWLGLCASAAVKMLAGEPSPAGLGMLTLFSAVGIGMLVKAVRETRLAQRHEGASLLCDPPRPRGGQTVRVSLRSAQRPGSGVTLRVAEYRVDDSTSTNRTRLAWEQRCPATIVGAADGATLQASFELPIDAAASESRRDGERVYWCVEWLDAKGDPELSFDLAVQAGPGLPVDRWAPRPVAAAPAAPTEAPAVAPVGTAGATPAAAVLPDGVTVNEFATGIEWQFARRVWRVVAVCAGVAALVALVMALPLAKLEHDHRAAINRLAVAALLLAAALHGGSLRWRLRVDDDGASVDRSSWMWPRVHSLPRAALARLDIELAYTVTTNGRTVDYHRVQVALGEGGKCVLTPGLPTREAAEHLARRLMQAADDRGARFAPGQLRSRAAPGLAPATQMLLAWLGWALAVGLVALAVLG